MSQLIYTSFQDVLFPPTDLFGTDESLRTLHLRTTRRFKIATKQDIRQIPIVVFDFETTGLNPGSDRIIEIGAIKLQGFEEATQFHALIDPEMLISPEIEKITGISQSMVQGQATIQDKLPEFLEFIDGSLLVAHNAEFDMGFLRKNASDLGTQLDWDCFCSLKLARSVLPHLESKSLDSLATHYQLQFEARHRSIGDCKVTAKVLAKMLAEAAPDIYHWQSLQPFSV